MRTAWWKRAASTRTKRDIPRVGGLWSSSCRVKVKGRVQPRGEASGRPRGSSKRNTRDDQFLSGQDKGRSPKDGCHFRIIGAQERKSRTDSSISELSLLFAFEQNLVIPITR